MEDLQKLYLTLHLLVQIELSQLILIHIILKIEMRFKEDSF